MRKICLISLMILLFTFGAQSEDLPLSMALITLQGPGDSVITYPVFSGENSGKINAALREDARLDAYEDLLNTIQEGSTGLQITSRVYPESLTGPVLSVVLSARGKMLQGRPSQVWYVFLFDTASGERLTYEDLFSDPGEALAILEEQVLLEEESLNDYMENRDVLPLPLEGMALSGEGVTLCYPISQMSTLSGFGGDITVPYSLLRNVLKWLPEQIDIDETTREQVFTAACEGRLGNLPLKVGGSAREALALYRSSLDPGYYPDGLAYEVEDSTLHGTVIFTDASSEVILGLTRSRFNWAGIEAGVTGRAQVLEALGEPDEDKIIPAEEAQALWLPAGDVSVYHCKDFHLVLSYDSDGVLKAASLYAAPSAGAGE